MQTLPAISLNVTSEKLFSEKTSSAASRSLLRVFIESSFVFLVNPSHPYKYRNSQGIIHTPEYVCQHEFPLFSWAVGCFRLKALPHEISQILLLSSFFLFLERASAEYTARAIQIKIKVNILDICIGSSYTKTPSIKLIVGVIY